MKISKKLKETRYTMLFLWMFSAFVFGIGLGAYVESYIRQYALAVLFAGMVVHLYTMYRIYMAKA